MVFFELIARLGEMRRVAVEWIRVRVSLNGGDSRCQSRDEGEDRTEGRKVEQHDSGC